MKRVAILGHPERPAVRRAADRLVTLLERRGATVRVVDRLAPEMDRTASSLAALGRWCELLIALGGDGTALHGARALARRKGVLLPVNLGGLGFLAAAEEHELDAAVRSALAGEWPVVRRRMLLARVTRRARVIHRGLAVNDVVLKAAGGYSAVHLRLEALGTDLGHLVADGVIAASAAGSTAYSLSAGGPVVSSALDALVVTPVCPHALGSRSLVLGARDALRLKVMGSFDRPALFFDGQDQTLLDRGDQVEVTLSAAAVRVLANPARPLGRALRSKLGWQGSERRSFG